MLLSVGSDVSVAQAGGTILAMTNKHYIMICRSSLYEVHKYFGIMHYCVYRMAAL
jgi:hypothetical protein